MDNTSLQKRLNAALKASKAFDKATSSKDRLGYLTTLTSALEALANPGLTSEVAACKRAIEIAVEAGLAKRREEIARQAKDRQLTHIRYEKYDRIDIFEVHYSGEKVSIKLGSLQDSDLVDSDGSKTITHLVERRSSLVTMCLKRNRFFSCIESALAMATADGRSHEGKVAVRDLFPYVALRRQLERDKFTKQPDASNFVNYSLAEFAFELLHFGSDSEHGWTCGEKRLNNRGPAMSTQHLAIQLPDQNRTQVYMLWIE